LPTALSQVLHFRDEVAIVLERFDRIQAGKSVRRVHQEDMCQALAVMPSRKYQSEGGPGVRDIADLLESHSSDPQTDVETFLKAVIFNWLIAGTDAHAKNYAILISGDNRRRLAPLYDLSSTLPYKELDPKRLKLSMKIGDEYALHAIGIRQWQKLARSLRLSPEMVIAWVRDMAEQTPDAASTVAASIKDQGLKHPIIKRLADAVAERAKSVLRTL
jgi:serine/threonine-protein kinase HipA